jgi:DNA-binding LytR/AlgR family response regulator
MASISTGDRLRILVVEDEPLFAEQIEAALEDLAYHIIGPAPDAASALALLKPGSPVPDVALLDIHLSGGGLDGIELAQRLLELRPIPLIFLTSLADDASFARARAVGPAAYLVKPVDAGALQRAIELAVINFSSAATAAAPDDDPPREPGAVFAGPDSGLLLPGVLFVKEEGLLVKVPLNEVNWVTIEDGLCRFVLSKGRTVTTRHKLRDLTAHLPADRFVQIHRSYIINSEALERLDPVSNIVQVCGQLLPLGRSYRDDLLKRLQLL